MEVRGDQVMKTASNVSEVLLKTTTLDVDVPALLGPSGQKFCAGLAVYGAYQDQAQQQPGKSMRTIFVQCVRARR